jgi:hypothetical protein
LHGYAKFYHGVVADGRQLLLGWGPAPEVAAVALWFSPEGEFIERQVFALPERPQGVGMGQWVPLVQAKLREWGFRPQPIRVRHFYLSDPFRITLRILSDESVQCLCDPLSVCEDSADTTQHLPLLMQQQRDGYFKLVWQQHEEDLHDPDYSPDPDPLWENHSKECPLARDQLYPLRTYGQDGGEADFYTGVLPDGGQALMGPAGDKKLLCVTFHPTGQLKEVLSRPLGKMPRDPSVPKRKRYESPDPAVLRAWQTQHLLEWQRELGWQPQRIQVRPFMLDEGPVYISSLPCWGLTIRYDPYFYPDFEERQQMRQRLTVWEASGNFVFWWGRDYHIDKDGNVVST